MTAKARLPAGRALASCQPRSSVSWAVGVSVRTGASQVDAVMKLAHQIGGEHAALAAAARRGIARHGMHQHADARRGPRIAALREDAGDRAGEDVPGAGCRHTGIAALTQSRRAPRRTDQGAGTLEHHRAVVALDEAVERT